MGEVVLFHNDPRRITVTNNRLILGDEVTEISQVRAAHVADKISFRQRVGAIVVGVIGVLLVLQFSLWSILGLLLLLPAYFTFANKERFWVFVVLHAGGSLEERGMKSSYTKDVAHSFAVAVNDAVQQYRIDNDPRRGLDL